MRRELIVGVTLLAALGAACGGSRAAPPSIPAPASELAGAPAATQTLTPKPTATLIPTPKPSSTPTPTPSLTSSGRPEPPLATLVIAGKEQIAGLGSYCWRYEDGRPLCTSSIGIPTAQDALPADSPFTARLRLPVERPVTESQLTVYRVTVDDQLDSVARGLRWWRPKGETREPLTLTLEGETTVELSLEPGLYVLSLFARWKGHGDAAYGFLVEVR